MVDLGADTWIMHGTLLGWWWNAKVSGGAAYRLLCYPDVLQIMPWDSDIDVQVSLKTMHFLASYYNMTIHHYATSLMPAGGRNYMLEINPGYTNGSPEDKLNVIDARFIDTETGVFIDITTVRIKEGEEGILQVKDKHEYKVCQITYSVWVKQTYAEISLLCRRRTYSLCETAYSKGSLSRYLIITQSYWKRSMGKSL